MFPEQEIREVSLLPKDGGKYLIYLVVEMELLSALKGNLLLPDQNTSMGNTPSSRPQFEDPL